MKGGVVFIENSGLRLERGPEFLKDFSNKWRAHFFKRQYSTSIAFPGELGWLFFYFLVCSRVPLGEILFYIEGMNQRFVLIMDDDPMHRSYMRDLVSDYMSENVKIVEAPDAETALSIMEEQTPDLCVFDLQLPNKNGVDVAKEVWLNDKSVRILFWSQHADELYVRKLFSIVPEDSIYGFLTKTASEDNIISAIQSLMDYEQCWIDPKIRKVKQTTFDKTTGLSDIEYETLVDLALGLSDKAIAERRFLTRRGVQNRLSSLYSKLGVSDEQISSGYLYSPRSRAISLSFIRGLINQQALEKENGFLQEWLKKNI